MVIEKIKKFLEFTWIKLILALVFFLVFPVPLGLEQTWNWFPSLAVSIFLIRGLITGNLADPEAYLIFLLVLLISLLIFYPVSCLLIFLFKKIRNLYF